MEHLKCTCGQAATKHNNLIVGKNRAQSPLKTERHEWLTKRAALPLNFIGKIIPQQARCSVKLLRPVTYRPYKKAA